MEGKSGVMLKTKPMLKLPGDLKKSTVLQIYLV